VDYCISSVCLLKYFSNLAVLDFSHFYEENSTLVTYPYIYKIKQYISYIHIHLQHTIKQYISHIHIHLQHTIKQQISHIHIHTHNKTVH
jgi:hypothetical protein